MMLGLLSRVRELTNLIAMTLTLSGSSNIPAYCLNRRVKVHKITDFEIGHTSIKSLFSRNNLFKILKL